MARLLQFVPAALIAILAIEGSVVHLAHSDHCRHRHGQVAHRHGDGHDHGSDVHEDGAAEKAADVGLVSGDVSVEESCFACSYLSQRTAAPCTFNVVQSWGSTGTIRPPTLAGHPVPHRGPNRARAPPRVG